MFNKEVFLMKLLFSFIFLLFSSLSLQIQAQILIEYEIAQNMNRFDWSAFSNKENIQKQIDFRNQRLIFFGAKINTLTGLKIGKSQLIQIEQELDFYKQGIKTGLSTDRMKSAEEAIALHWDNINNIEAQIKTYAGLMREATGLPQPTVGSVEEYYNGVWELHEGDHEVVFNMVEKKNQALYNAFGRDDEAYAGFIAPYVQRQMERIESTAGAYWSSLQSSYSGQKELNNLDVANLIELYMNSLEIYNCFNKNFTNIGVNQQVLMGSIKDWHTHQALLGANSLIETYNTYGDASNPRAVVIELLGFYEAPDSVRARIVSFLRNDIFYNNAYIYTDDRTRLGTRVNALIGLNSFDVATPEEQDLFNKAIGQGIIEYNNPHNFFGRPLPLPE